MPPPVFAELEDGLLRDASSNYFDAFVDCRGGNTLRRAVVRAQQPSPGTALPSKSLSEADDNRKPHPLSTRIIQSF